MSDVDAPPDPPLVLVAPGRPDFDVEHFAQDADLTVYWPRVRACWEERAD